MVLIEQRKIIFINFCITVLVCITINYFFWISAQNEPMSINQTQTVNVNTNEKEKVNLNTASKEELESLPNIGEKTAQKIIDGRPYNSIYDLKRISGIGLEIINNIKEEVVC